MKFSMLDQSEQLNSQSRLRRLITNPWGRVGIAVVLIALVGVAAYFVFGLVTGGAAQLYLTPSAGQYFQGNRITVSVMLDSANQPVTVTVVGAYIRYDSRFLELDGLPSQAVRIGSGWNAATASLARATDVLIGQDPDRPTDWIVRELEVVIGQSTPGIIISASSPRQVAQVTFRVKSTFPPTIESAVTRVWFDTNLGDVDSRTMVILDDESGTDILGGASGATFSLFRTTVDASCTTAHPGAFVCGQNEFCPTPSQYIDIGPTCCSVTCIAGQQLTIDESSIYPEIIKSGTTVTQVIIHWRTNLLSTSNVINFQGVQDFTEDTTPVLDHAFVLAWSNQNPDTTYQYQVTSVWKDPNPFCIQGVNPLCTSEATSQVHTFTLQTEQVNRLQIFDLSARGVSNTSAVISWTTNYPSRASIVCTAGGCNKIPSETKDTTIHSVRIIGLTENTFYRFKITARADPQIVPPGTSGNNFAQAEVSAWTKNLVAENDANVILKVERDRVCDNWLTCTSSLKVTNKQKKIEDMCFALGECDRLDPTTGQCLSVKSDAPISRFVTISGDRANSTVDQAKNLSGYSKAELVITGFSTADNTTLKGFSSFASLRQYGSSVAVVNGTFDTGVGVYPWTSHPSNSASFDAVFDEAAGGNVMQIASSSGMLTWGAKISLGKDSVAKKVPYFVSFDVRADLPTSASMSEIKVQFGYRGYEEFNAPNSTYKVSIGSGWEKLVVGPFIPPEMILGEVFLGLLVTSDISRSNHPLAFYVDNVLIQPVLQAGSGLYIPRVCRAYPTASAPTCDYFDPFTGKAFRGWKGYCLVPDPKDSTGADCLQWWPVDVISGTASSFGSDPQAGYLAQGGRFPLYYCLEAEGNYPYLRTIAFNESNPKVNYDNLSDDLNHVCVNSNYQGDFQYKRCPIADETGGTQAVGLDRDSLFIEAKIVIDTEPGADNAVRPVLWLTPENNFTNFWRGDGCEESETKTADQLFNAFEYQTDILPHSCIIAGVRMHLDQAGSMSEIEYGGLGYVGSENDNITVRIAVSRLSIRVREACSVLAQVVDPFGRNAAQTARVSSKTYKVPGVQYGYVSDYRPFGAVVHPDPDYDPAAIRSDDKPFWKKLFFEPPSAETFSEEPFQVRAGNPYGLKSFGESVSPGYCRNNPDIKCDPGAANVNERCRTPDTCVIPSQTCLLSGLPCGSGPDCNPPNTCQFVVIFGQTQGGSGFCSISFTKCNNDSECGPIDDSLKVCVPYVSSQGLGKKTCITGPELGKTCNSYFDCGMFDDGTAGHCTGVDKPKDIPEYGTFNGILAGDPGKKLSNLFVKTYGTWQWIGGSYKQICKEGGQAVCTDGSRRGERCGLGTDILSTGVGSGCYPGSCGYVDPASTEIYDNFNPGTGSCGSSASKTYGWDEREGSRAQALGVQPKAPSVSNVKVNEKESSSYSGDVTGTGNLPVELSFTSHVDVNQLPLVRYTVDWGDGEVTSEGELSLASKSAPKNPHRLGHVYRYFEPSTPYPFGCTRDVNCDGTYGTSLCTTTQCSYKIRIQIQDNWGWCNGTGDTYQCGLNTGSAWTQFGKDIVVTP